MFKYLRSAIAATVFALPIGLAGTVTLVGIGGAQAGDRWHNERHNYQKVHVHGLNGHHRGPRFRVRGPVLNNSHWMLRRAERGLYGYWRDALIDSSNPLTGPTRYHYSNNRGPDYVYDGTDPAENGVLKLGATRMSQKPSAHIINVDEEAVELAEQRAEGRWERFEDEEVEIRFHTPRQAYDSRFPSVIYLDSR